MPWIKKNKKILDIKFYVYNIIKNGGERDMKNPHKEKKSKIQEARKKRGWTQEYLAQITGLSTIHIKKLENGEIKNPGIETAKKLAYALGLDLEQI